MKEFDYKIKDKNGIHARPAGMLVKEVSKYNSKIIIKKDDKTVDARRLFALMGISAKSGDTIRFFIEGDDEEEAAKNIKEFVSVNL